MALDAYEGEQRLNHTASNREHVWRLLQGGELIAPVPALPPRETPSEMSAASAVNTTQKSAGTEPVSEMQAPNGEAAPSPPFKKTSTRKAETAPPAQEPGSMVQVESEEKPPVTPPKRSRKKKTTDKARATVDMEIKTPLAETSSARPSSTDAVTSAPPPKSKRTRRVEKPKPKRYPVGEQEAQQGS